jgi:probable F420-dependent oxidoreductase
MGRAELLGAGMALPRIAVATRELDELSYTEIKHYIRAIEDAGVGMIYITEAAGYEAFTLAQLSLDASKRAVVGNGIARALDRVPKNAAAAQALLWDGFPGRYLIGFGVSSASRERGLPPVPFMRNYLADFDEQSARLRKGKSRLPRVLAGYGPGMISLAAEQTDGLVSFLSTPSQTSRERSILGPDAFLSVYQWIVYDTDPARARATIRKHLRHYFTLPHVVQKFLNLGFTAADLREPGSDRLVDACCAWGSHDQIAARVQEHLSAGADQVSLQWITEHGPRELETFAAINSRFA